MSLASGPGRGGAGSAIAGSGSATGASKLQLHIDKHVHYIQGLDSVCVRRCCYRYKKGPFSRRGWLTAPAQRRDELDYWLTEHLRLNGLYWGLTALHLLGRPDGLPRDEVIAFVLSCMHENGGFGAAPGHDPHMLYTVSAVQILAMVDGLHVLDERGGAGKAAVGKCQKPSLVMCPMFLVLIGCYQTLQACSSVRLAALPATSGARLTHAFSTEP